MPAMAQLHSAIGWSKLELVPSCNMALPSTRLCALSAEARPPMALWHTSACLRAFLPYKPNICVAGRRRLGSQQGCVSSRRLTVRCRGGSADVWRRKPSPDEMKEKDIKRVTSGGYSDEGGGESVGNDARPSSTFASEPAESLGSNDSITGTMDNDSGSGEDEVGTDIDFDLDFSDNEELNMEPPFRQPHVLTIPVGGREIIIETGKIGRLASGAVTIRDGDTVLYATACAAKDPSEPGDFVPFSVNYQERFSAAGRTSGGFIKREGKARDHEVLTCRLIDRPLRPMLSKDFPFETQMLLWVFSYDGVHSTESLAITAAGTALAISDIPLTRPVAGVRVGMVNGEFVVNPTVEQMKSSPLDMIIGGTAEAVLMIEGYCDFLTDEQLLEALRIGQEAIATICHAVEGWAKEIGKAKRTDLIQKVPESVYTSIQEMAWDEITAALRIRSKIERGKAMEKIETKVLAGLTADSTASLGPLASLALPSSGDNEEVLEDDDDMEEVSDGEVDEGDVHVRMDGPVSLPLSPGYSAHDVKRALKEVISQALRRLVVSEGVRSDGRGCTDIRSIDSACGLLPRAHGSSLFTRGETQAIVVATIGGEDMAQRVDNLTQGDDNRRFYLQYSFPPSSVGEVGKIMGATRRELGHGTLAERALYPVIPPKDTFPYTIRVESTITESNGSSSMASVCGGCLALLDAGVPLLRPVAGVAMGLILDTRDCGGNGEPLILSDILGSEDALGDMDFKVAGDGERVTAFQMDIKVEGITLAVMAKALAQARDGRQHVLGEMAKCSPPPSRRLSRHAPRIKTMKIPASKVNVVIGSGGKTIRSIIEETGVESIDVDQDGSLRILSRTSEGIKSAMLRIFGLTMIPVVGKTYRNCKVKSIMPYGCFVEVAPGKDGLVHISELQTSRLEQVEDFVKVGDTLDVKLLEINARGQLRFSHKAVLLERQGSESASSTNSEGESASARTSQVLA